MNNTPTVLAVDHSSALSGAELCLIDIATGFSEGSRVFLFEDGPLRESFESQGTKTTVSQRANSFKEIKKDQSLLRALPMASGLVSVTREIAALARQHNLVYANSQKAFALSAPAAWIARRPLVWHLHDIMTPEHFSANQRRLAITLANRFAKRVIVPSQATAEAFTEAGGRRSLVTVVPNGVDVSPEPASKHELRDLLGLPKGFLIGVFSRLAEWKGQHVAIQALARIPNAHFLIVGGALFEQELYADSLQKLSAQLGVSDRVHFLGHRRDVHRLLRAVDVMVHPSVLPEPFARTIIEAMLCRTPVVAANNGGVCEIIQNANTGFLLPTGDVEALAKTLSFIMQGVIATDDIVNRAEQQALGYYNKARMIADVQKVIAPLVQT